MTVTINLNPELEAGLLAQAAAGGMTVEAYVQSVIEGAVLPAIQNASSAEMRAAAFEAWSQRHSHTPLLSEYAVSRAGIYEGCDS